jgi:UDPglucose--hexose-1-phosphate uridylyltransferase
MSDIHQEIENLIGYELKKGILKQRDVQYVKNKICYLLNIDSNFSLIPEEIKYVNIPLDNIVNPLGLSLLASERLKESIMNCFCSLPSEFENKFFANYEKNPDEALRKQFAYAQDLYYVKQDRIDKNVVYNGNDKCVITINLSKPEKDPRDIANALNSASTNYPACHLCIEHEGYQGNSKYDPRINHELIGFNLNGKKYYFQYSPYSYFNEHCIILNEKHVPMVINLETIGNIVELTNIFPAYLFGSNADLPIVGGSILTHDHYQGGRYVFPVEKASVISSINLNNEVISEILDWPLSTLRLSSKSKEALIEAANKVLLKWIDYNDETIVSHTNAIRHNTITPIARKKGDTFTIYLILRNNLTSDKYPLGIYHPHEEMWGIKKENIGLIEAIGLAVLPKRLKEELLELEKYLTNHEYNQEIIDKHKLLLSEYKLNRDTVMESLLDAIARIFYNGVLKQCGVLTSDKLEKFIKGVI